MSRKVLTRLIFSATAVASIDIKSCRRCDLPLYTEDGNNTTPLKQETVEKSSTANAIESSIRQIRVAISKVCKEVKAYESMGAKYVNDGVDQAQWLVNYLGEEQNVAPKGPAIAIGGLTGLIFALRGGFFRKIIFTTAGALGMASICYPNEASHYSKEAITEGKVYATIAYNFIYGVTKDDPPLELPSLPKLPGSISEVWSMATNLGKSSVSEKEEVSLSDSKNVNQADDCPDPNSLISQAHNKAIEEQCHCDTCFPKEDDCSPAVLPYPPPVSPGACCPNPPKEDNC